MTADLRSFVGPGEGRSSGRYLIKTVSSSPEGGYAVFEGPPPPRATPVRRHVHAGHEEAWYVLSGTAGFLIGDEEIVANAGSFVVATIGTPHAVWPVDEQCNLLSIYSPARFIGYIEGAAKLKPTGDRQRDHELLGAHMERWETEWFDPFPDKVDP